MVCSRVKVGGFDVPGWPDRMDRRQDYALRGDTMKYQSAADAPVPIARAERKPDRAEADPAGTRIGILRRHRFGPRIVPCTCSSMAMARCTPSWPGHSSVAILQGQLRAGAALPATRALAAELGLSRNTVLTAYEMLRAEQLAVARVGSGTFVSAVAAVGRQTADQGTGSGPDALRRSPAGLAGTDAAQCRASPALRLALRRASGQSDTDHRMATRAGTRGERRRLGLPAERRPACACVRPSVNTSLGGVASSATPTTWLSSAGRSRLSR